MEATNNKSMTSKDEVAYWDSILDEYENNIGLPKYNP